jgi:hypothetical protein
MAMRETERSLRWFFLIAGALSVVQGLATMSELSKLPRGVPMQLLAPIWYGTSSHVVLGALFFVAGLRLKQALLVRTTWIEHLILIAGASLVIEVVWMISIFGVHTDTAYQAGAATGRLFGIGLRFFVVGYLYRTVRRLSNEAQAPTAGTQLQ